MSENQILNPVLRGFNPDPCLLCVGKDYYIATSTFEWYPGIRIYHSRNLADWELVATPLNRLSQLDMRGEPDSCGVWAPCLTYNNGLFYLVYTDVKRFGGDFKDTHNYVVTAQHIQGPWSEPVYLNSSGFDPSLFHNDDGRKWLVNMIWDHRQPKNRHNQSPHSYFYGIALQEYCEEKGRLVGTPQLIFKGSGRGFTEGPHLYKFNGYYYLLTAEGGTGKDHAATFARSEELRGPYEIDPQGSLLTSADQPLTPLKRAGHASLTVTPEGKSYLAHLCSRPLPHRGMSVMGRETAIQEIEWVNGWPRLAKGDTAPALILNGSENFKRQPREQNQFDDFDGPELDPAFQTLRLPVSELPISLTERPGYLRLKGAESIGSLYRQSLVARRQQAFVFDAETKLEFAPNSFQQMAGLVSYYNSRKYYYLHVTWNEQTKKRILDLSACMVSDFCAWPLTDPIELPDTGPVWLKVHVNFDLIEFFYATSEGLWHKLPVTLDYSLMSDEAGDGGSHANFTGAFVGICCQDLTGMSAAADYDYFAYREIDSDGPFSIEN